MVRIDNNIIGTSIVEMQLNRATWFGKEEHELQLAIDRGVREYEDERRYQQWYQRRNPERF